MNLFIPPLSSKMKLTAPWTFTFYREYRNRTMECSLRENGFKLNSVPNTWDFNGKSLGEVTLPIGTQLTVKRIYIRTGQKGFDSITFIAKNDEGIKGRFWVKLEDANKIEMEVIE